MNCLACEGTGIHMRHGNSGQRFIVNPKRGSCPTCGGNGKMPIGNSSDHKSAAAAESQQSND